MQRHFYKPIDHRLLQIAHSTLAASTILTLLFTRQEFLLHHAGDAQGPICLGATRFGGFCVLETDHASLILLLLAVPVVFGIAPFYTGWLHVYAAFSLANNTFGVEGGDQLAVNLGILFTLAQQPTVLQGFRRVKAENHSRISAIRTNVMLAAAVFQMGFVYFEGGVAKLYEKDWAEGTALWYWVQNPGFTSNAQLQNNLMNILQFGPVVAAVTWGSILLEVSLAIVFWTSQSRRIRQSYFALGLLFHLLIAIVIGLFTFGLVMVSGLLLLLHKRNYLRDLVEDIGSFFPSFTARGFRRLGAEAG